MKVIPHRKPPKPVKPYKAPKPKRYALEWFSYQADRWIVQEEFHFAFNAKYWARYWEDTGPRTWRVVDRKST